MIMFTVYIEETGSLGSVESSELSEPAEEVIHWQDAVVWWCCSCASNMEFWFSDAVVSDQTKLMTKQEIAG